MGKKKTPSLTTKIIVAGILIELPFLVWYGTPYAVAWSGGMMNFIGLTSLFVLGIAFIVGLIMAVLAVTGSRGSLPLEAASKQSMLMGQSADFPTEQEHKRSGKFK